MEKRWGFFFASGFLYLYLYLYKSPCRQVTEMKGINRECRDGWNSPVWGICCCLFLGASWVPCVGVCDRSCSDSVWLLIPWGPGFLCKCKGTFTALSLISPSVWHLSIVTDGHASSDWSLGPMFVCVHLGLLCIVFVCVRYVVCVHDAWCMRCVGVISGVFSLLVMCW